MSKDAKLSFAQSIGLMIVTGILMAVGWIAGFIDGTTWGECKALEKTEKD